MSSAFEKRREARMPHHDECLFSSQDKSVFMQVRDASSTGVGVYTPEMMNAGQVGALITTLPDDKNAAARFQARVCWCYPCDDERRKQYPFRAGFLLLNAPARRSAAKPAASAAADPHAAPSSGHRVKGGLLIDFAKMVRRHHDRPWQKYLTQEDMEIISDMIIPAAWYPLDTFRRAGNAVFELFGNSNPEAAKQWGREMVERIPAQMFKSFFDKQDPKKGVMNYVNVNARLLDFMRIRAAEVSERALTISFHGEPSALTAFPELRLLALIIGGAAEQVAVKNGAREAESKLASPAGQGLAAVEMSWK